MKRKRERGKEGKRERGKENDWKREMKQDGRNLDEGKREKR